MKNLSNKLTFAIVLTLLISLVSITLYHNYRTKELLIENKIQEKTSEANLIVNSINGKIEISYDLEETNNNMVKINFSVTDTGIGMDQRSMDRIFNKFEQANNSTSRNFGGTGLGLSICKGIVTALRGEISVESKENIGSVFKFSIVAKKGTPSAEITNTPVKNDMGELAKSHPLNILIADDNSTNRLIAKRFLEQFGYKTNYVCNGKEVLLELDKNQYDVILMDGHMPELDGYDATKIIRSQTQNDTKPWIIALTASVNNDDKKKCIDYGMNDFLAKPLTKELLYEALMRVKI